MQSIIINIKIWNFAKINKNKNLAVTEKILKFYLFIYCWDKKVVCGIDGNLFLQFANFFWDSIDDREFF